MTKKEIVKLDTQQIVILAIFIITGGIFALSAVELGNTVQTYTATQDNIANQELAISQNALTAAEFKKLTIDQTWLTGALPTQDTLVNWIQQMDIIAQNTHVTQSLTLSNADLTKNSIIIPPGGSAGNTPVVGAEVILNGSYNNILSYITLLKKSYYYIKITGISFSGSGSNTQTPTPASAQGTVTASLNLELFVSNIAVQQINQHP